MRNLSSLLTLPPSLLAFIAFSSAGAQELQWPYNLPRTAKYFPEHEAHIKRDLRIQEQLAWQAPAGVRKMSDNEGEKFFLDYWDFGKQPDIPSLGNAEVGQPQRRPALENGLEGCANASYALLPAFAPHTDHPRPWSRLLGRSLLQRDYQCPVGTTSCGSLGQDSCCQSGETCITVTNTGNGNVGCCPAGATCGTSIGDCDASQRYISCPNSSNGGCCIPGYACQDVGCVLTATQTTGITAAVVTVTVTAGQSQSTQAPPPSTTASEDPGSTIVVASVSPYTVTTTVTPVADTNTITTTVMAPTTVIIGQTQVPTTPAASTTPLTCSASGFTTCPASLGGGCCLSGLTCGSGAVCIDTSTATSTVTTDGATAAAPFRPTSNTETPVTVQSATSTETPSSIASGCPTGFYMCSAYYMGGCCRVGRDCDTTSCPTSATTSILAGDPTVVALTSTTTVPGGTATAAAVAQGNCPQGWFSCPASVNGGCCPSGLACAASSCHATVSGARDQPKAAPSSANVVGWAWSFLVVAVGAGVGMVVLW